VSNCCWKSGEIYTALNAKIIYIIIILTVLSFVFSLKGSKGGYSMRHLIIPTIVILSMHFTAFNQQVDSFAVFGTMRSFVMHVPAGITNPPLVISMHGYSGTGSQQRSMTGFDKIADREKFIVVYPNGLNNAWKVSGDTDRTFLLRLVDTINSRYGVDRNRVYATGFSMGGLMSYQLACSAADKIAAIGPVAGMTMTAGCKPARPVPVIHIHGTADTLVDYSGVAGTISFWVGKDGCPSTPQITKPYPPSNTASKVTKDYYGPCNQGSEIILLSVDNMGHAYPGSFGSTDINASEEIWAFFKTHSLIASQVLPKATAPHKIFTHYDGKIITIRSDQAIQTIQCFDVKGALIFSWNRGSKSLFSLKLHAPLSAGGVYVLNVSGNDGKPLVRRALPVTMNDL
jgi:poly(3-hydroxybutyrate) depolymerase